jgi:hypothetical protein
VPKTPEYAAYDGYPCRFSDYEAWMLVDGKWQRIDTTAVVTEAAVLTEQGYLKTFGVVPPLPSTAFRSDE